MTLYEKLIVGSLIDSQEAGKGEVLKLTDEVYGFKKGDKPRVLITSGHHGSELYGTYESLLQLINNSNQDFYAIPAIDSKNFDYYKSNANAYLAPEFDDYVHSSFIFQTIKGSKGIPAEKECWDYGTDSPKEITKTVSDIIEEVDLVIDMHNSFMSEYLLITSLLEKSPEKVFFQDVLTNISEDNELYDRSLSVGFNKLEAGLYETLHENTVCSYAKERGCVNFAIETPVLNSSKHSLRDFDKLAKYNASLLEYCIESYNSSFE